MTSSTINTVESFFCTIQGFCSLNWLEEKGKVCIILFWDDIFTYEKEKKGKGHR